MQLKLLKLIAVEIGKKQFVYSFWYSPAQNEIGGPCKELVKGSPTCNESQCLGRRFLNEWISLLILKCGVVLYDHGSLLMGNVSEEGDTAHENLLDVLLRNGGKTGYWTIYESLPYY